MLDRPDRSWLGRVPGWKARPTARIRCAEPTRRRPTRRQATFERSSCSSGIRTWKSAVRYDLLDTIELAIAQDRAHCDLEQVVAKPAGTLTPPEPIAPTKSCSHHAGRQIDQPLQ